MAGFVFIHGAWLGGWTFDPVRARLVAMGHAVDAPDLPGMGDDAGDGISLAQWGAFAVERCRRMAQLHGQPPILVGHSRGGIVPSQAAEQAPDAMAGLVYISAMLLPGGSVEAAWNAHIRSVPRLEELIRPTAGGKATILDKQGVGDLFAQRSPPGDAAKLATQTVAEPNSPRSASLRITLERYGQVPRTFIACTHDQVIPIADQRAMAARQPGTGLIEIEADHSPFYSAPDILAATLDMLAKRMAGGARLSPTA